MGRPQINDEWASIKDPQKRHRARRYAERRCWADGNVLDLKKDGATHYRLCKDCRANRNAKAKEVRDRAVNS